MLKNMKIRSRLLISYLLITVLLLIVGIVSIVMLQQESNRLQEFYNQQFQTVENALDIRRTVFAVRGNIISSIVEYNEETVDSAKSDFQSLYTLLDGLKGTYQGDMSLSVHPDRAESEQCRASPVPGDRFSKTAAGR